jgi:hypothetical protein
MSHLVESWEPRGRISRKPRRNKARLVRLSGKSKPATPAVKSNYWDRTLKVVSDGAFRGHTSRPCAFCLGSLLFSYTPCHRISRQRRSLSGSRAEPTVNTRFNSGICNVNDMARVGFGREHHPPHTEMAAQLLPEVLYETLGHPSDIENTIPRRMVLATRFRGSSLRLPLSGLASF